MPTPREALAEFKRDKGNLNAALPEVMKHLDGLFEVSLTGGALSTKAEILEACGVAITMGGGPTMAYVPLVLEYLEEGA